MEGRALLDARPGPLPREAEPLNLRSRGDPLSQLSRAAVWLTEWTWLDRFTPTVIRPNSVFLALPASYDQGSVPSEQAEAFLLVDAVFLGIVAFEFGRKALARGLPFGNPPDYLRDSGNVMGFVVLGTGGREMLGMRGGSLKVLRTFRVFRPLRSQNKLPERRTIVGSPLDSIPSRTGWRWLWSSASASSRS